MNNTIIPIKDQCGRTVDFYVEGQEKSLRTVYNYDNQLSVEGNGKECKDGEKNYGR